MQAQTISLSTMVFEGEGEPHLELLHQLFPECFWWCWQLSQLVQQLLHSCAAC